MHCHKNGGVTKTAFGNGKKAKDESWFASYFSNTNGESIYHISRTGASPGKNSKMYIPIYTDEKLPDSQFEDLAAYFCFRSLYGKVRIQLIQGVPKVLFEILDLIFDNCDAFFFQ